MDFTILTVVEITWTSGHNIVLDSKADLARGEKAFALGMPKDENTWLLLHGDMTLSTRKAGIMLWRARGDAEAALEKLRGGGQGGEQ